MEVITNADYTHAKRVCKDFKVKNLGEDHDLYVSTDRLLSADVFNDIRNMYLEKYVFDPANFFFFFALGLAWQAIVKKSKVKLDLLTDVNM